MKYILILLLFFSNFEVHADVVMPEAITDKELIGNWHAIDGNGLVVYRLEIKKSLTARLLWTYRSSESKGIEFFPEGKVSNVGGDLNISFFESPTTFSSLNLIGKGFSCKDGDCLLVLRESVDSKPIFFYRKPLAELASQIVSADKVFDDFSP